MSHNYLEDHNTNAEDRALALRLQQFDPLKRDVGVALTDAAQRLAERYQDALSERGIDAPSKIALFFEVEDADDAAVAFTLSLERAGTKVAKACFWIHRRKNSFDNVIVEVGRVHSEEVNDADLVVILQPGAFRPEAVRAFVLHSGWKLEETTPILVLTSWSAPDLEDMMHSSLEENFLSRVTIGYLARGTSSGESRFFQSTKYSSQQREGMPSGWDKNDFYPASVMRTIEKQMNLARENKSGLNLT